MKKYQFLSVLMLVLAVACGSPAATNTAVPPTAAATEVPTEVPTALPTARPTPSGPLTLTSDAFEAEGDLPARHGQEPFTVDNFVCTGSETDQKNVSPGLTWKNVPQQTKSLALIMVDDLHFAYPDAPEGAFFPHWVVYNLPPDATGLAEGQSAELSLPEGRGEQGLNGYPKPHDQGYGGPCPGPEEKHLYIFTLYALDTSLALPPGAQYEELLQALEGHILEQAELKGYYTGM
jgi:Raf kinase inhibitor-like YbhB/YbcL family protein